MTLSMTKCEHQLSPQKSGLWRAFWIALVMATALFLPFIIYDKGLFIYYGDFNVQQIPFYQMAHDAVRAGDFSWCWTTDLGANFIGSYSFYLLGSPFFWLTLPFPSEAVPYLMGPLLILKFASASATAYVYLQRFVSKDFAVIGGLLYAFSGFSLYNVFFNHFHEAIIYFPLMLTAMELYMKDNRRGYFAVTVFLSALNNYYFFIGQVFFLVIYWFIRMLSDEWECTLPKFLGLAFEAVAGTAGAAILLFPSYLAVVQNNRVENTLTGWNFLIYDKPQRFFDIIHSFFFPQDIPARENFFPDSDNKWASMSAWLPVFGCTGAIAFFQSRKHTNWLRRLLIVCVFCALIPGLNAMFQLFNSMYYARWFYMMVLMLVLATVTVMDQNKQRRVNWNRAFGWSFGITAAFACFIGFMPASLKPDEKTGKITFGLMKVPERFWVYVSIAMVCLALAYLLILLLRQDPERFIKWAVGITACISVICGWFLIGSGKAESNFSSGFVRDTALGGADQIKLPTDGKDYVRVDFHETMDNMGMFWKRPTIQAFQSIVPGSIMEFYPTIGVGRSVGSRPNADHYALRSLLSVRWLFDFKNEKGTEWKEKEDFFSVDGVTKMPGWNYVEEQHGFDIYENSHFIPMGFTYDKYITRKEYDDMSEQRRELVLLKALVVEKEDEQQLLPWLNHLDVELQAYSYDEFVTDCTERAGETANSFIYDSRGFTATISLDTQKPVFFSVPYEKGWKATVDGKTAEICKSNVGFMSVLCPAGENVTIRFDYETPGLIYGALITGVAVILFILYIVLTSIYNKKKKQRVAKTIVSPSQADACIQPSFEPDEIACAATDSNQTESVTVEPDQSFSLYEFYRPVNAQNDPPEQSEDSTPENR